MLVAEDFCSWDARENKAITRLCTALDDVVANGRPSQVECFPASLSNDEFVRIAVDLCDRAEVNVAILGNSSRNSITLVPLVIAAPRRPSVRGKTYGALVGAGTSGDIFI